MNIIKKYLNTGQWIAEDTNKEQIVLHHTVSSTWTSAFDWWNQTEQRVATAFIVDKDGTIYEVFPPNQWAYHLGKGTTSEHNKKTIGIEIVNEGPLTKKDNKYYWLDGKALYKYDVVEENWRGYTYWASYTNKQFIAVVELLNKLIIDFRIEKNIITHKTYIPLLLNHKGILSHCNVRKDKTDVSPAFNLKILNKMINNKIDASTILAAGLEPMEK